MSLKGTITEWWKSLINAESKDNSTYSEKENEQADSLQHNEEYVNGIWIRGNEGKYFATMGNRIISKDYVSIGGLKKAIDTKEWDIIINVVLHTLQLVKKVEEEEILTAMEEAQKSGAETTN